MSEYNGWSSYETWAANIEWAEGWVEWQASDKVTYETQRDLADALKDAFMDDMESTLHGKDDEHHMVLAWARRAAENINWWEIADYYTDRLLISESGT